MNERREKRIQIWLMMKRMKNFKYLFNAAALSADKMDFFFARSSLRQPLAALAPPAPTTRSRPLLYSIVCDGVVTRCAMESPEESD